MVVVFIIYSDIALSMLDGASPNAATIGGAALWSGAALACHRRRSGFSGWAGFIVGVVASIPTLVILAAAAALLRRVFGNGTV